MRIVLPTAIADADILTVLPGESEALWSNIVTYAAGAIVRNGSHRRFESVQAGNLSHPLTDPAWWRETGPTSPYAMFDGGLSTQTVGGPDIYAKIQVASGRVDSLALLNIVGTSARVIMTDAVDGVVYDQTFSLISDTGVEDWYGYYLEPIETDADFILTSLPAYFVPQIEVYVFNTAGAAKVGMLMFGQQRLFGITLRDPTLGIVDYSRKEADAFGNYLLSKRRFSRTGDFVVALNGTRADAFYKFASDLRATPALWVMSDVFKSAATFGFYRDFKVSLTYRNVAYGRLTLEGLS